MSTKKSTLPAKSADTKVTKYERWVPLRIRRDQIRNAPYNPRMISAANRKKLLATIKKEGMLGPVNFNPPTRNCYGGNQRLAVLDALEGRGDYYLTVAAADPPLSLAKEKAACMRLNNEGLMGDWDLPLLAQLLKEPKADFDLDDTGFEEIQLESLLGEEGRGIFGEEEQNEETRETVDDVAEMAAAREEEAAAAKERRQNIRKATQEDREENDSERVAYVMFPDRKAREAWVEKLGLPPGTRYVPAKLVAKIKT